MKVERSNTSEITLAGSHSYDIEKNPKTYQKPTTEEPNRQLGLFLFVIGFLFPLTWILGTILCHQKGIHHSKKWFIANGVATILMIVGLAICVIIILVNGSIVPPLLNTTVD